MARPCKNIEVQSRHNTKEEIENRKKAQDKLRGLADKVKSPPKYLTKDQKKTYKFIYEELKASNILGNLDIYVLATCSIAIDRLQFIYEVFDGTYAEFRKQGRALRGEAPKPRPMRKKREDDEESRPPRRWKNQDDGHRSRRDFKRGKDSDGWEKDRHGVKRRKAKNPLEERYHKPYSERRRDFNDEKVRKNVRFKMPKLFDESEWGETEVVMRHRNRKDNKD